MIVEAGVALLLTVVGFLVLARWNEDLEAPGRACLSLPIGAAVYLLIALGMVVTVGTLHLPTALAATAAVGLAGAALGGRYGWRSRDMRWLLGTLITVLVVVVITRVLHYTRLTPDSLRYLLASNNLHLPDALAEIHPSDLHVRNLGVPALQALSELTDRRYLASIGPLFGVHGFAIFLHVAARMTSRLESRSRLLLLGSALMFLAVSNRLLYDFFYLNTHIYLAVYLLIAAAGIWAAAESRSGWAVPAGLALAVTLLFRPEAPLVVALFMVVAGAHLSVRTTRLWVGGPPLVVVGVWYGTLSTRVPGGDVIALDAPIFGGVVAIVGAGAVLAAAGFPRLSPIVSRADLLLVGAMTISGVVFVATDPELYLETLEATTQNLILFEGHWGFTWPAIVALVAVALARVREPPARLWAIPVVGYGLLWWLLPFMRDGPWRVGAGDSGNRILAHILLVAVAYLVFTVTLVHDDGGRG